MTTSTSAAALRKRRGEHGLLVSPSARKSRKHGCRLLSHVTSPLAGALGNTPDRDQLVLQRGRKCSLNRPSKFKTCTHGSPRTPAVGRPLRQGLRLSAKFYPTVTPLISCLLSGSSPTDIAGGIRSIVVRKPVQRERGAWSAAHIGEERLERSSPFRADRDTAPPIVSVLVVLRIFTTLDHQIPDSVLGTFAHVVGGIGGGHQLPLHAATGLGRAAEQVGRNDAAPDATVANGHPAGLTWASWVCIDRFDGPCAESLAYPAVRSEIAKFPDAALHARQVSPWNYCDASMQVPNAALA